MHFHNLIRFLLIFFLFSLSIRFSTHFFEMHPSNSMLYFYSGRILFLSSGIQMLKFLFAFSYSRTFDYLYVLTTVVTGINIEEQEKEDQGYLKHMCRRKKKLLVSGEIIINRVDCSCVCPQIYIFRCTTRSSSNSLSIH